jgi:molybdopterin converting factor small subunit
MHVGVVLYGAVRVVIGQPLVEVSFDTSSITLGQLLERMIATYPRARPYLLDEAGLLPSYIRILINNIRPDPDATLATTLHHKDQVALLVAVAGGQNRAQVSIQLVNAPLCLFKRNCAGAKLFKNHSALCITLLT